MKDRCSRNLNFKQVSKKTWLLSRKNFITGGATGESNSLLGSENNELRTVILIDDDNPFSSTENESTSSMLLARDAILQGC